MEKQELPKDLITTGELVEIKQEIGLSYRLFNVFNLWVWRVGFAKRKICRVGFNIPVEITYCGKYERKD